VIDASEHVSESLNLFRFVPGYEKQIVAAGKEALLLLLLSFLVAFGSPGSIRAWDAHAAGAAGTWAEFTFTTSSLG
jgi:hypothetical protein